MKLHTNKHSKRKGKRSIPSIIVLIAVALIAYFFNVDGELYSEAKPGEQIPVKLIQTIDGDTIKVLVDGKEENVRYLLIDTPEIDHQNPSNTEPFARAASNRNDALLKSGQVTIEFDVGDRRDQYDRLLAYIYVDGKSVQKTLLEEGYARVAYVFEPNTKYVEQFRQAEREAKKEKIGIWEKEGYVTNRGFDPSVYNE